MLLLLVNGFIVKPFNKEEQDHNEGYNQEVHKNPDDPLDTDLLFMSGHQLAVIPVLRNSSGAYALTSYSYFIPSHRT